MDTQVLQRHAIRDPLRRGTSLYVWAIVVLVLRAPISADEPVKNKPLDRARKPITTATGELGGLLRQWWREGTAAGNVGDFYDNRDGGHSDLDTSPYPQLQRIVYTADDIKLRRHWAGQRIILPHVVFGNSSTSAPFLFGGSNPRMYYTAPAGLDFLYQEYTHNNVYIYPEHRDHDPGHNGANDGYGDAYPTNTPYLIISQGSSGSDQPFMRAIPFTLAAFRPEVKRKLTDSGLLMPTLQMILRSSNRHLKGPEEYLTGKAHPSVFEGGWVNDLKMVQMAHGILPGEIPPMVRLKVVDEDRPVLGKDFFEASGSEKLAETPASISRIFRGKEQTRRLVVSAKDSYDLNKRPLRFHWVVLRGDPKRIRIKTLNSEGDAAEIVASYHERQSIAPGSPMESNRIDIGVFAHNGAYYSAPAFITYFSLDHEGRTYDDKGRIAEIGFGMGETTLAVIDWDQFLKIAISDTFPGRLLGLSPEERALLEPAVARQRALAGAQTKALEIRKTREADVVIEKAAAKKAAEQLVLAKKLLQVEASRQKKALVEEAQAALNRAQRREQAAAGALTKAQKDADAAGQQLRSFLSNPLPKQKVSLETIASVALRNLKNNPTLVNDHVAGFADLYARGKPANIAAVEAARKKLLALGVVQNPNGFPLQLAPLRSSGQSTIYEHSLLEEFNGTVLANLAYPATVSSTFVVNYVDPRLSAPRAWRDVYRYDDRGHYLGWTRYALDGKTELNPEGFSITKKDHRGRCMEARTVRYLRDPPKRPGGNSLRPSPADERITYEYDGDQDSRGRIKSREKIRNEPK
jgi:hypothetical protein